MSGCHLKFHKSLGNGEGSLGSVFVGKIGDNCYAVRSIIDVSGEKLDYVHRQSLKELNSKFLIKFFDSFEEMHQLHILMEFCESGNLRDVLRTQDLKEMVIIKIFIQSLLGLHCLHLKKIIHGNLKPENIFVDRDLNIKIGDFGLKDLIHTTNCGSSVAMFTPEYLSPEIAKAYVSNETVKPLVYSEKSDVWSLGIIVYEMLTKKVPFQNAEEILSKDIEAIPKGEFNAHLSEIVYHMLKKETTERMSITDILKDPMIRGYAEKLNLLQYYPLLQ